MKKLLVNISAKLVVELYLVIFNDGVGEEVFGHFFQFGFRFDQIGAGNFKFDDASDADSFDTFHPEAVDGLTDGFALGIENTFLRGDDDGGFHKGKILTTENTEGTEFFLDKALGSVALGTRNHGRKD
jgi:hypothetical protein